MATRRTKPDRPVLTTYDEDHLLRLALPLGGISCRTVRPGPHRGSPRTDFWDDFLADGAIDPRRSRPQNIHMAWLAAKTFAPGKPLKLTIADP